MAETSAQFIQIGRTSYAVGLEWKGAPTKQEALTLARAEARRRALDLIVIHTASDGSFEFATGSRARKQAPGMQALASALVNARTGSWTAIFDLPDKRLYVLHAVNGVIDPQTDKVVSDIDAARDILYDLDSANEAQVYADPIHGIKNSIAWPLEQAIAASKSVAKFQLPDTRAKIRAWGITVVAVCSLGALSYVLYTTYLASPPKQQEKPPTHIPEAPWVNRQAAREEIFDCLQAFDRMPSAVPDWKRSALVCQGGTATAAFTRDQPLDSGGAPVAWLHHALTETGFPAAGLSGFDPKVQAYTVPLPRPRTVWTQTTQMAPLSQSVGRVLSRLDGLFVPASPTQEKNKYYSITRITFRTDNPPDHLSSALDVPGATLASLKHATNGYEVAIDVGTRIPLPTNQKFIIDPAPPIRQGLTPDFVKFYEPDVGDAVYK